MKNKFFTRKFVQAFIYAFAHNSQVEQEWGIIMTYEKLVEMYEQLSTNTFERCLYIEYILFCNFAPENEFNNYFRIEEIKDTEFFKLVDFLYNQNCYNLLYRLLRNNRERITTNPDISFFKDIDFRSGIEKRMERFAF